MKKNKVISLILAISMMPSLVFADGPMELDIREDLKNQVYEQKKESLPEKETNTDSNNTLSGSDFSPEENKEDFKDLNKESEKPTIKIPEKKRDKIEKTENKDPKYEKYLEGETKELDFGNYDFSYEVKDKGNNEGNFKMSLYVGNKEKDLGEVSDDQVLDFGFGNTTGNIDLNTGEIPNKPENKKKVSYQFALNKNMPNRQLIDTNIDVESKDINDLKELLRQSSIITKGSFLEDGDAFLLYSKGNIKTFKKDMPFKDILSFYNSEFFEVLSEKSRVGDKYLVVDSFEKNKAIKVLVDGKEVKLTASSKAENGMVFLPVRDIANAMGASVEWNKDTYIAKISKNNKIIEFKGSSDVVIKDSLKYHLSEKTEVTPEKRLLTGVSILVKAFNYSMYWDSWEQALTIESPEYRKALDFKAIAEENKRAKSEDVVFSDSQGVDIKESQKPHEESKTSMDGSDNIKLPVKRRAK